MTTISPEDRAAMQDAVRRLMADHSREADVRRTMETPSGYDPALWRQLSQMGVVGLMVAAEFGGTGAGPIELERVMEEAGAALLCAPLLSSGVLAAGLIAASGDREAQSRLLPGIAAGTRIATVALTSDAGTWTADGVAVTATEMGGQWLLTGVASYVIHGQSADLLLIVARTQDGFGIFEINPDAAGLTIAELPTFDRTLRLARFILSSTPAQRIGAHGWDAVQQTLDLALVALAGEQAGGARRMFEITVDYAKARLQFGRPIGSFQAIKHMAADLLLETESATSAARYAAEQLDAGTDAASAAVSLAAFACADAFSTVTANAIQMHGGIAFTWEHPAHLYLRRARADAQLLGASSLHRERYLVQLGG